MSNKSGNYIEIAGGAITEHCTGEYNLFAQKMSFNAEGTVSINGAQKGTSYKTPIEPPKIVLNQGKVKKVELVTNLDLGSKNDKSGGTQLGMIFGKEYTFQVTQYDNETPLTRRLTKWQIRYHSPKYSQNKWIDVPLKVTGDTVKITMNEEDMCGRFIYVRAYIDGPKSEGEIKVWKHNRFRWFDSKELISDLNLRINNSLSSPYYKPQAMVVPTLLIDQGGSSLCGIAVVGYNFIKEKPFEYINFVVELHRTGKGVIQSNNYSINIDSDQHLLEYKVTDSLYPSGSYGGKMSIADFIFLVCIKDFLNNVFDYAPDDSNVGGFVEGGTGLTLPNEVASLMKNILNYSDVINDTNLVTSKWQNPKESVGILNEKLNKGYKIGLLISVDNFQKNKNPLFTIPTHWVGLNSVILNEPNKLITISVFTWGGIKDWTLSFDSFQDGYFGFVAGK
ncbi:hypothetical protein ACUXZJ_02640 [Flavobacterium sp. TN-1]